MTRALPPTIALVDQTRTIPTADLAQVAGALGEQISNDLEPVWQSARTSSPPKPPAHSNGPSTSAPASTTPAPSATTPTRTTRPSRTST
jgi:uncharacterized protein YggE